MNEDTIFVLSLSLVMIILFFVGAIQFYNENHKQLSNKDK